MGIAGFFLWLQRWYQDCLLDLDYDGSKTASNKEAVAGWKGLGYDNFYVDMNGLIHPCCHDTAPKPEPESEEEMIERVFDALDKLFRVVLPKKCLVLAIDGVAPRSKLNQQRCRRFRAAQERLRSEEIMTSEADQMEEQFPGGKLPRATWREKWDHNQITPSTAFMERVATAIEWFVLHKINTDPQWAHVTVIFSDAHVPGEGEHKIVQYIRTCREQPGYDPNTSHVIVGMDADLICLALSTHEANFSILRNCLTENFQQDPDRYCLFSISKFRNRLKNDFGQIKNMKFERVVDDFVFLCFFVGNDFLPNMPLINIKAKGIETLLDHYVRKFDQHGYLTKRGEIAFDRVAKFLQTFVKDRHKELLDLKKGLSKNSDRASMRIDEKIESIRHDIQKHEAAIGVAGEDQQALANKILKLRAGIVKEREGLVSGKHPLPFSYGEEHYRDMYYQTKFGWSFDLKTPEGRKNFEENVQVLCLEYHRGMQWVLRYYTVGCPSWEWYYPFYYAPLLEDVSKYWEHVNVDMQRGAPLNPLEQLLAVLPRESVAVLPEELHTAVLDRKSVLSKFYPEEFEVDFREASFSYQGVPHIPFINVRRLQKAVRALTEIDTDLGDTFLYTRSDQMVGRELSRLIQSMPEGAPPVDIPEKFTRQVLPMGGRVKLYERSLPLKAKYKCPDQGLVQSKSPSHISSFVATITNNQALTIRYEWNITASYRQVLLEGAKDTIVKAVPQLGGESKVFAKRPAHMAAGGGPVLLNKKRERPDVDMARRNKADAKVEQEEDDTALDIEEDVQGAPDADEEAPAKKKRRTK